MRSRYPCSFRLSVSAAALLLASMVAAEEARPEPPARGGCRAEIAALCPDTEPGSAERRACLRANGSKLSEACRERMMRRSTPASAGIEGLRQACGEEIDTHCDDVRHSRMLRCLRQQDEADVSQKCRGYLEILAVMRKRHEAAGDESAAE